MKNRYGSRGKIIGMSDFNVYYLIKKYAKELFLLRQGLLCRPCWPQTCYVVQEGLELMSDLPASALRARISVLHVLLHLPED